MWSRILLAYFVMTVPVITLVGQNTDLRNAVLRRGAYLVGKVMPPKIVYVGDSITAWAPWGGVNLAVPRLETRQMAFQVDVASKMHAQYVSVLPGANDIINPRLSEDQIVADAEFLLSRVKGPRLIVTLTLKQTPEVSERIERVNKRIRLIAERLGAQVIDINPVIAPNGTIKPEFTIDGVHLNGRGYEVWENQIRRVIEPRK